MPTNGGSYYGGFTENIPRWEACKRKVTEEMVAAGWNVKAGKFSQVMRKKAMKLFDRRGN